jgi:hypothetical protein
MGFLARSNWSKGWVPDADAVNGPVDGFLRGDNLTLDEVGALVLRGPSTKINGVALADLDVHSLFTAVLTGTRYRMTGASNGVYANGAGIVAGMAGAGDVSFGSYQGQILFARSTSKKKYDGATVRNWGIAMTGAAPTLAALAPDSKTLASGDSTEAPAFTAPEGTGPAYATGQDLTVNGSIQITPSSTTGRGVLEKVFAAETDFTVYDGGQTGGDNDLLQFYVYITEPSALLELTVMVDVNGASTNRFQDDYYTFTVRNGETIPLLTAEEGGRQRPAGTPITGFAVRRVIGSHGFAAATSPTQPPASKLRPDAPVGNAGWNRVQIPRGQFERIGSTAGKDWKTVQALRLVVTTTGGGAGSVVRFDNVKLIGGNQRPLTGAYQWIYMLVYNSGTYTGKSPASAPSAQLELQVGAATVTFPADGARDSQANEIWLFRMGGTLDQFYRVGVKTGVVGTGAITFDDTLSDQDALVLNLPLEVDNALPPDNIIGIAGPYYTRVFALTATDLYPSRRFTPDTFANSQAIHIAGADETCYWVKKTLGGLYVGTSKDIYRLEGTGAELPDDTIDFVLTPLNIDHPPIGAAVTQEGNDLVYLADDGWRAVSGSGSVSLSGATSLLYQGKTRHGISPVNLATGRFRAAIVKGRLTAITPEGASTTTSTVLYRVDVKTGQWLRAVYPASWRSIAREPDGTLIAGDTAGFVWVLDDAAGSGDATATIPVTFWTTVDDDGAPFARKDPLDLRCLLDTGNVASAVAVHLDNAGSAATTLAPTLNGLGIFAADISAIAAFTRAQLRITGSFLTFRWESLSLAYHTLPMPFRGRTVETNGNYAGEKVLTGLKIRACTLGVSRTFTPYLDGVALPTFAFTSATDEPDTYIYQFTATQTATDLSFSVDGDIELYDWEPLVLYQLPVRLKIWENKPLERSPVRRRFGGLVLQIHTRGATATVTPVVDGVDQPALTIATTDLSAAVLTFNTVVGRDLWARISSATPFNALAVEPIVLETLPQWMKGLTPRSQFGSPGVKTLSGLQLRLCTLGAQRVITPVLDGTSQSSFTVASGSDDPIDATLAFVGAKEAVEIAFSVDGNIELYDWKPLITAQRPLGIRAWDSGPLDLGTQDLVWVRAVRLKVRAGAPLTITPWFDGVPFASVTTDGLTTGVDTVVLIPVGRGYVGRQPRLVVTSTAPFYPYWIEFTRRLTGYASAKPTITVPALVGGSVPA